MKRDEKQLWTVTLEDADPPLSLTVAADDAALALWMFLAHPSVPPLVDLTRITVQPAST